MTPPPYPRVPHLLPGRGSRDDTVLGRDEVRALLGRSVVVEEKLDGANVVLWDERGLVQAATRGGPGAIDRAGQLGPLRAWAAEHGEALRGALEGAEALYAEWLLLRHTVVYDRLASYLVVLDVLLPGGTLVGVDERDQRCRAVALATPPELARGVLDDLQAVEALLGPSRFGASEAEGLIVRALDGGAPRLAKLVRPGFAPLDDAAWRRGRPRNRLAQPEASWR